MRIDVSYKYLESSDLIENILDKNIQKIERKVQMFKKDSPVHVSIHLEKNPHREQYFCRTQVYLPSKVLTAAGNGNIATAVNNTFSALNKQLEKMKFTLERHLGRRKIVKEIE